MQIEEISDHGTFKRWLEARPKVTQNWEAAILLWRMSARNLAFTFQSPEIILHDNSTIKSNSDLAKISLIASAIAWQMMLAPTSAINLVRAAEAAYSAIRNHRRLNDFEDLHGAKTIGDSVYLIIILITQRHAAFSATELASYSVARSNSYVSFVPEFWQAIQQDCQTIVDNGWAALRHKPLWPKDIELTDFWQDKERAFRDMLRTFPNQHVWLRWYERVYTGRRASEEIEMLYASDEHLPLWEKENGFELVTDWIAERLAKIEEREAENASDDKDQNEELPPLSTIPAASPIGLTIGPSDKGPLHIIPDPKGFADAEQADLYNRLRLQLQRIIDDVPTQELGSVRAVIDDFMMHPTTWDAIQFKKSLWVSGNQLRSILSRHDAVVDDHDPHPDKLATACAAALRLPVETWNIAVIGDEALISLDSIRLGPGERSKEQDKLAAATPVIAAVTTDPAVMLKKAASAVTATLEAAKDPAPGINGDQAVAVANATSHGAVRAVLVGAYKTTQDLRDPNSEESKFAAKEFRGGAYKAVGEGAVTLVSGAAYLYGFVFLEFVALHAAELQAYAQIAYQGSQAVQMIDMMKATWDRITK